MATIEIENGLVEAVQSGQVVLFLGAGASVGATKEDGSKIPVASELGRRIADKFLGAGYDGVDFKTICDFAASARSGRELQSFIHDQLIGFRPAAFHLKIPKIAWSGIATTNYDLIVEEAYKAVPDRVQDLIVNCCDGDGVAEQLGQRGLLFVKLHGCITHYQNVNPPLVASTEQIINHREGRAGQFALFLEWAKTKTIVFAGYGIGDFNLRTLFEEIRRDGDNHPRHYIVRPGIMAHEQNYWQERRVKAIEGSFEDFLTSLDNRLQSSTSVLALLPAAKKKSTSFSRFIAKSNVAESSSLIRYLESQCEHVSAQTDGGTGTAAKFYRGFDLGWYPIENDLDIRRRVTQALIDERIIPTQSISGPQFVIVKGHAGAGKTVLLRRLAWLAAKSFDRLVFYLPTAEAASSEIFEEIVSLTNQTIYVIVDDVVDGANNLAAFYRQAERQKWKLVVIGGSRVHEWNMRCDELEALVNEEYELRYLSETEIDALLQKLSQNNCLGHLARIPASERHAKLKDNYGRQLLVALHEAIVNATFREIIANEYSGILPVEARLLYLDICSLHRFGSPVRAGLIARVHAINFEDFNARFFKPLEEVIHLVKDKKTRDWVYQARHPVIADIVYHVGLPTIREKFDNLIRIISKLNSSYSYDREVLRELIRAGTLAEIFKDRVLGNTIYDTAVAAFGVDSLILHQRGIYEMRVGNDIGAFDRAGEYLERALELSPGNPTIKHSLAELSLKRSAIAKDEVEKEAWRRRSETQAAELVRTSRNSYPQHTLAKVAISRVREALERSEHDDSDLSQGALELAIKGAEDILRAGLQRFPNDDRLLIEEASLSEILENAGRALQALQKAHVSNPRSELVAKRLARVLVSKKLFQEAIDVLRQTLELNPGSQQLHYDLARTIIQSAPAADITQSDVVLYHLQRSFAPEDKNFEARFWYARQLCLVGNGDASRPIFGILKRLPLPYRQRRGTRGIVRTIDGGYAVYYGQLVVRKAAYGFIQADQDGLSVFVSSDEIVGEFDDLQVGQRVQYNLGFSLEGPAALAVRAN